ncbi:diguanylate cyclase/phosphodiesterase (GGDEF & EAL domains) with PAS/PAC sensor(s) [hydrothermal vent metagenome]|uniref:Diguanylate cyclase/phosphodiesterase (GGDEF & EAL domains) with PAS/PAC sensor(S) n=1 Tax=hydrothermal vent metagenome TaxID=652676 RepID=A0A3B0WYF2_9ZZZZ
MKNNSKFLITAGFVSIVMVMILLAVFYLSKFRSVKQAMTTLVEQTNVKTRAANTMRDTIRIRSLALRNMQLETDVFKRDKLYMDFINYATNYREARNNFQYFVKNSEEISILKKLKKSAGLSQPINFEAAELLMSGAMGEELEVVLAEAQFLQNNVFDLLDKLVVIENKYSDEALLKVNRNYKETQYLLIFMILISIIISIVVAFMVIKSVGIKNQKIVYQATHDSLTGLINRDAFEIELTAALKKVEINDHKNILFYMDLDNFKIVNDTCGHVAGDQLLKKLPKLFQKHKRKYDSLARLGGDEFGLLLIDCNLENAKKVAVEFQQEVENFKFHWENKIFSVGISIGIVLIESSHMDIYELLSEADTACYTAKNKGGNNIQIYRENNKKLNENNGKMHWLSDINEALKNDHFILFYQLILPLNEIGKDENYYEVLLRYRDKSGEILPPSSLLSTAERFGMIGQVDRWVIKNAFIWLSKCKHIKNLRLSINLSGKSLNDEKIFSFIEECLHKYKVDPRDITFEVTETAAINTLDAAKKLIKSLKEIGCKFSLDDFGSSLSSFKYLKNLPVNILKIDGGFVKNIVNDPVDFAMVKSIHDIGKTMGMLTIAEFVETEAIIDKLREIGIDYAQGYAIAKPSREILAVVK